MARINHVVESEDELPELSDILGFPRTVEIKTPPKSTKRIYVTHRPRKDEASNSDALPIHESSVQETKSRKCLGERPSSKQRPLRSLNLASANSLLLPPSDERSRTSENSKLSRDDASVRSSPRRKANAPVDYSNCAPGLSDASFSFPDSEDDFTDLSGFIVPDSASDDDLLPTRASGRGQPTKSTKESMIGLDSTVSSPRKVPIESYESSGLIDLTSPKKKATATVCPGIPQRRLSSTIDEASFDLEEPSANLSFSPPRSKSPYKSKQETRPITPPSSPAKAISQSPSKKHRIPPSPHRSSIDAFWSQDVINDWNEQYSPKKSLKSPRKVKLASVDEDEDWLSPSESPRKTTIRNPGETDKKGLEQRKAFEARKNGLATSFLAEVDQKIAQGQVAAMAESTGGIKVIWSKKLSSTAGRANWRREAHRSKGTDGTVSTTTYRHHASIELAEKVIDDEDRLVNVIAHEYCHLANFMISGIKDNPHGKEFKLWARKTTNAFAHRNVNVTTKHAYEIAYKYIWACISPTCGLEYKRHSKSIDPARHSCGSCKSKLEQIQPVPRKGQTERKRSDYQAYVKTEQARVRLENPGAGFGEIMAVLGREFRESKKLVVVKEAAINTEADDGLDSVARKLDFLSLI